MTEPGQAGASKTVLSPYTPCRYAQRWPELFALLADDEDKRAVSQSLANGRLEGWKPSREEVADLVDEARGAITFDEYKARVLARSAALSSKAAAAATQ